MKILDGEHERQPSREQLLKLILGTVPESKRAIIEEAFNRTPEEQEEWWKAFRAGEIEICNRVYRQQQAEHPDEQRRPAAKQRITKRWDLEE